MSRCLLLMLAISIGCSKPVPPASYPDSYGAYPDGNIQFLDDAESNGDVATDFTKLTFTDKDGKTVLLADYLGKKSLVLVMTRGYAGSICPYCATQTSRLIANYPEIRDRNSEVLVVYPLEQTSEAFRREAFVASAVGMLPSASKDVPFPLVLDIELKAVEALGIRKDLSKPATYIFDKNGKVQFAYVGSSLSDRPSVKAILTQLDRLNKGDG